MDIIFLLILFIILVLIIFIFNRIVWKSTIWSSLMAALWWSLLIILLIQVIVPRTIYDNEYGVIGFILVILIVLVFNTVYITDTMMRDVDINALYTTNRNLILW